MTASSAADTAMIDAVTSVIWSPILPWWAIICLGLAILALTVTGLVGRLRGTLWRFALMSLLLLALANPSLIREQRAPIPDIALLVYDNSPSQQRPLRQEQLEAARAPRRGPRGLSRTDHVGALVPGDVGADAREPFGGGLPL